MADIRNIDAMKQAAMGLLAAGVVFAPTHTMASLRANTANAPVMSAAPAMSPFKLHEPKEIITAETPARESSPMLERISDGAAWKQPNQLSNIFGKAVTGAACGIALKAVIGATCAFGMAALGLSAATPLVTAAIGAGTEAALEGLGKLGARALSALKPA